MVDVVFEGMLIEVCVTLETGCFFYDDLVIVQVLNGETMSQYRSDKNVCSDDELLDVVHGDWGFRHLAREEAGSVI